MAEQQCKIRGLGREMLALAISDLEEIAREQHSEQLAAILANMKAGDIIGAEPVFRSIADTYAVTRGVTNAMQTQALRNLAAVCLCPKPDRAIEALLQGLLIEPENPQLLAFLTQTYFQQHQFEQARPFLDRLTGLPDNDDNQRWKAMGHEALGVLHHMKGRFIGAVASYEAAIAGFRRADDAIGLAESLGNLGLIYRRAGDLKMAKTLFTEALALWRNHDFDIETVRALGYLASVHFISGDYDDAIELFSERVQLNEALADIEEMAADHANLGQCFHREARMKSACRHWREAFSLYETLGRDREVRSIASLLQANGFEQNLSSACA